MGAVRDFMDRHFLHFNSRETVAAAKAYEAHVLAGGKMLVTLAGAMSTARIGRILGRLIQGQVHAISCTGANLEEDVFNLLAAEDYRFVPEWRGLRPEDEKALYDSGFNRVTDTCIPETVMRHLEKRLIVQWKAACAAGVTKSPAEHLFDILDDPTLAQHFQIPVTDSWMVAAKEKGIPVLHPRLGGLDHGQHVRRRRVPARGPAARLRVHRDRADGAPDAVVPREQRREGGPALDRVLPDRRRHRRRLPDLRRARADQDLQLRGHPVLGLLLPDQRRLDLVRRLLGRGRRTRRSPGASSTSTPRSS